jgi:hypothetical protein
MGNMSHPDFSRDDSCLSRGRILQADALPIYDVLQTWLY